MKSLFITFEGGEGSGKSTQAKLLFEWMQRNNMPSVITKEPGSNHIKECVKIRELLLNPQYSLSNSTELLLFLADRAQHVSSFIKPSLNAGKHVICDRYADSTRVYQNICGLNIKIIDFMLNFAINGLIPDITFILDIPVNIGLKRAKIKSPYKEGDRIENANNSFHESVRDGFLKLAKTENRFHVINFSETIEEIHSKIVSIISKKLWE